jgi:hypothetical protein
MLVLLMFPLRGINPWVIGLKASPKLILSGKWIDATSRPSAQLNMGIFLEKPARKPTRIEPLDLITIEKPLIRGLTGK